MNNIDPSSPKFQKELNDYLSTEEGAKEMAKVLPILQAGQMISTEKKFEALGQQIERLSSMVEQSAQQIVGMKQFIQGNGQDQGQSVGQISPKEGGQKAPVSNEDLANLMMQMNSKGK